MTLKRLVALVVLIPVALLLIAFIIANREMMVLEFNPFAGDTSNWQVRAPVFLFLFIFLGIGVVLGSVATWIGQHKYRKAARRQKNESEATSGQNLALTENGQG